MLPISVAVGFASANCAIRPALEWIQTPPATSATASTRSGSLPARSPPIIPVNTSPDPAVPNSGLASMSTNAVPLGPTTKVRGPLATTIAFNSLAAARTQSRSKHENFGNSPRNSPICGVITLTPDRVARAARKEAEPAIALNAPASRTSGREPPSTDARKTLSCSVPEKPGPTAQPEIRGESESTATTWGKESRTSSRSTKPSRSMTMPTPACCAPNTVSSAAPGYAAEPAAIPTTPREYL